MNKFTKRSLSIIFLFTIFSVYFSGSIDYQNPQYSKADLNKYIDMADVSPGLNQNVIKPFVYRIAAPWIAGLLPFSTSINFMLLNFLALIALALSIYFFLIEFGIDERLSLIVTIIFQMNKYAYQFLAWNHFQLSDSLSLAFLFYSFILVKRKKYFGLLVIMLIGMLVKEYMLMIIPAGFVFIYIKDSDRKYLIYFASISLLSFLLFAIVRMLISSEGGESLFIQYTTQIIYYSKPSLLVKRFIIPFTPFGLLPIIFYKELYVFFKTHKHFLIYVLTVIILSFFGEPERLMIPLSPVYYLFIAILIKKYIVPSSLNLFIDKSIILILILSFMSTFYHLWGLIILPNQTYSIVFAIILTLMTSMIFYLSRSNQSGLIDNDFT
ncbi:MAG: hypothetical protein ABFS12_05645 [Bacteroidota bacterium]